MIDGQYVREFFKYGNGRVMHFDPCYKFLARLREKEDMLEKLQLSSGKFINYDEKSGKIVPAKNRDAKAHFKQIEDITSEIHIMQDQLERVAELYNKLGMSEPVYNLINAKRDQLEHRRRKQVRNLNACISIVSQRLNIPADKCEDQPDVKKWRDYLNETERQIAELPDQDDIVHEIDSILALR